MQPFGIPLISKVSSNYWGEPKGLFALLQAVQVPLKAAFISSYEL